MLNQPRYRQPGAWLWLTDSLNSSCFCTNRHRPAAMRLTFLVSTIIILTGVLSPAFAKDKNRCHMCGMDASKSQTEFVVSLDNGSQEHTCCLHCTFLLQKFMKDRKTVKLETRDFSTGELINAKLASYLEGAKLMPRGSMAPFLLAFKEKENAEKYKAKYGGTIVTFDRAIEIVAQFDKDVAPIK